MIHETKLLTFWRDLNLAIACRGGRPACLDVADALFRAGYTVSEAASVLAPTIWQDRLTDGLTPGWAHDDLSAYV